LIGRKKRGNKGGGVVSYFETQKVNASELFRQYQLQQEFFEERSTEDGRAKVTSDL
jgi:hypothetical protein